MTRILAIIVFFTGFSCFSQEMLRPLHANLNYIYKDLSVSPVRAQSGTSVQRPQSGTLVLPFIEDFSYADTSSYPDPTKWSDSSVYINSGFPIRPPSIGVATFDGLNKYGYPYNPTLANLSLSYPADTLTSQPINLFTSATSQTLQLSDSIALTFYYQARGNGEAPELDDSLVVDFYVPSEDAWVSRVWYQLGNSGPNVNDTNFKYAIIMIDTVRFLQDGFRFRFRGKASPTGSFDNWHVDYIILDKNLSQVTKTNYNDLTFAYVPTPFLQNYSAMPLEQYVPAEMATKNIVKIKNNNATATLNVTYESRFFDNTNTQVHFYTGNSINLAPFATVGYSSFAPHSNPSFNYTFPAMGQAPDSLDYRIEHTLYQSAASSDFINANNRVVQYQRFRNYYALDDGTAEAGYYINATAGKMAVKITVNTPDSLLAVRIYIDPVGTVSQVSKGFRINVWPASTSINGPANNILFQDTIFPPRYFNNKQPNQLSEYRLFRPRAMSPGIYYIGIQQLAVENNADIITVGFDKNTDHHTSTFYDAGGGWTQSGIAGSIMIRPVFGRTLPPPVGIAENTAPGKNRIKVYPNPASGQLRLQADETISASYSIINALGQEVLSGRMDGTQQDITTESLNNGIYILVLKTNGQLVQQSKLIIQH